MRTRRRPRTVPLRWARAATVGLGLAVGAFTATGCSDGTVPPEARVEAAYRLELEPCRGNLIQRASGGAVADDLIATVAHALDGARSIAVFDWQGRPVETTLVHLDEGRDIALLRLGTPAARFARPVAPTDVGPVEIVSYADPEGPVIEPGEIVKLVNVTLDGDGRRAAANLEADIDPGDSGSPVFDTDGRLVAMVFASVRQEERGWAVSGEEVRRSMTRIDRSAPPTLVCETDEEGDESEEGGEGGEPPAGAEG